MGQFVDNEKRKGEKLTGNFSLGESFKRYESLQAQDMLHNWKNKSSKQAKSKLLMV